MRTQGLVLLFVGLLMMLAPPVVADGFHAEAGFAASLDSPEVFAGYALLRIWGAFMLILGAVLAAGATALAAEGAAMMGVLFVAHLFAGSWAFMQQTAIWGSFIGWILVAFLVGFAVAYAMAAWNSASREEVLEPA